MSTIGIGGREGLRGLGEELVRLDIQLQSKQRRQRGYLYAWLRNGGHMDIFAGSELDRTLRPYCDPALLESHGEQLLDLFIRLASKEQWKSWLDVSARITVSMEATDILVRLFAAYEDPLDDTTLTGLLRVVVEGGSAEVLAALISSGAGPKVQQQSDVESKSWGKPNRNVSWGGRTPTCCT